MVGLVSAYKKVVMADVPKYFETSQQLRDWFTKNAQFDSALLVGFYKTSASTASITLPEACDEALCVGWHDVARMTLDAKRYTVRFTRRKKDSVWTELQLKRAAVLIAQKKMKPAGLAVFKARARDA
jgi:uncharacterized protein YdeI (YjbR/CyaY-like superfamily)